MERRGLASILEVSVNIGDRTIGVRFSTEERLILHCLRRDADSAPHDAPPVGRAAESSVKVGAADATAADVASEFKIACDGIDWERLTLAAGSHGVLPLVYRRLRSAVDIQPEALARMRSEFYGNSLNNLHLTRELARLTDLLKSHGVDAIAFKGPVLALRAWADVALRQFNDLDLLIRPQDALKAAKVLIAAGYWPRTFDLEHPAISIARRCEDEFMQPGSPWTIDLHWELNPDYFCYGPDAAAIWERTDAIRVEGADVLTLAPTDMVLFLAVHGTKHGWVNLGWICDFDETMRTIGDAEMPAILEAARSSGCTRMLLLALALAADLLGAPIPPVFADALRADRTVAPLVAGIERRLFASVGMRARVYSEWVVPLRTILSTRGRLRYFASRAFMPNSDDFDFVALPQMLYPLYYLLRPFRLALQQGRRLFVDVPHPLKRLRGIPR